MSETLRTPLHDLSKKLTSLSDEDLAMEQARTEAAIAEIDDRLRDDLAQGLLRGSSWRARALTSKRHYTEALSIIRSAQTKREKADKVRVAALAQQELMERKVEFEQKMKAKRHEEHMAKRDAPRTERARMFMAAAMVVMSPEDRAKVWEHARAMFNNHPDLDVAGISPAGRQALHLEAAK